MQTKLATVLVATAYQANAIKMSINPHDDHDDEMAGLAIAQGMAQHLLYTGCDGDEDCRPSDMYIDLREPEEVIQNHVFDYINGVLDRDDDSTDSEKEQMEDMIKLLTEEEVERAKRFIAESVTDYFRTDQYRDQSAEGIRQHVEDKVNCELDDNCEGSSSDSESYGTEDVSSDTEASTETEEISSETEEPPVTSETEEISSESEEPPVESETEVLSSETEEPPVESETEVISSESEEPPVDVTRSYTAYATERKTWDDALAFCREMHNGLAVITNEAENEAVYQETNAPNGHDEYWIGLTDRDISSTSEEGNFRWVDGTPATYFNWGPGEPNNFGEEDCAAFGHIVSNPKNKWNDSICSQQKFFVCMDYVAVQPPTDPVTQPEPTEPTGPKFFVPKHDYGRGLETSFSVAEQECQERGGHLASIRSAEELEEAKQVIEGGNWWESHWIGFTDQEEEGQFRWLDGSAAEFTNWNSGEPNNWSGNENCTEMNGMGGWNDGNCDQAKKFICRKNDL